MIVEDNEKLKVHHSIFDDMKYYLEDIDEDDYVVNGNTTDKKLLDILSREYNELDEDHAVDCYAWSKVNKPEEKLIYKEEQWHQIDFMARIIMPLFYDLDEFTWETDEERKKYPKIISTHTSKSVKLPVFKLEIKKFGITFVARCNIYDWVISVNSETPLDIEFYHLFDKEQDSFFHEGIKSDYVYGSYNSNHNKFTVEIATYYDVYTFFYLISEFLKAKNPKKQ